MINFEALFKVSYGLYIVSSGNKESGNGYISNTFFQVTSEPPKFATCCNKDNYTTEFIQKTGNFSVSVLHENTSPDIFGRFGYKSGKNINKLEGIDIKYGKNETPIVLNDAIAYFECKVLETIDLGTHLMFIGELIQADILDEGKNPITYSYYRQVKKGVAPKNAPTYIDKSKLAQKKVLEKGKKYKCAACGYIYDESKEEIKFSDLPDTWVCPICGTGKEDFFEISE